MELQKRALRSALLLLEPIPSIPAERPRQPDFHHLHSEPKHGYNPTLFFYLTGTGKRKYAASARRRDTHYPSVGTGIAYPQSAAAPAFSGDYGLRFTQELEGSETTARPVECELDNNAALFVWRSGRQHFRRQSGPTIYGNLRCTYGCHSFSGYVLGPPTIR